LRIRSQSDFWCGLLFIALGFAAAVLAQDYRLGSAARMGPGYFPTLLGLLLVLFGLTLSVPALFRDGAALPKLHLRPLGVILFAVVVFGLTLEYFGFVAAVAALVLVGAFADPDLKPVEAVAVAAFMVAFSVSIFWALLGLPLRLWPGF
jgi:putative tricarboxylic transport membrane protein